MEWCLLGKHTVTNENKITSRNIFTTSGDISTTVQSETRLNLVCTYLYQTEPARAAR
jgi:hypothetical protein